MISGLRTWFDGFFCSAILLNNTDNSKNNTTTAVINSVRFHEFLVGRPCYAGYPLFRNVARITPIPRTIEMQSFQKKELENLTKHSSSTFDVVLSDSLIGEILGGKGGPLTKKVKTAENFSEGLPKEVRKTLDKLFGSIDDIPCIANIDESRGVEIRMEAPIMKGIGRGGRFIAIKVDGDLTKEFVTKYISCEITKRLKTTRKLEEILFIYQYRNDSPCIWAGHENNSPLKPNFFTGDFTDENGRGPIESQKESFKLVKTLIKDGVSPDRNGLIWTISKN